MIRRQKTHTVCCSMQYADSSIILFNLQKLQCKNQYCKSACQDITEEHTITGEQQKSFAESIVFAKTFNYSTPVLYNHETMKTYFIH